MDKKKEAYKEKPPDLTKDAKDKNKREDDNLLGRFDNFTDDI